MRKFLCELIDFVCELSRKAYLNANRALEVSIAALAMPRMLAARLIASAIFDKETNSTSGHTTPI